MLRKTAIIVRHARAFSNQAVFVKYCPDFKVFSRNHERSIKIDFLSMSYMVGHFNNSRALKNTFLELSCELNFVLRKTAIIVRHARAFSNQAVFVKDYPDFKVFSPNDEGECKNSFSQ